MSGVALIATRKRLFIMPNDVPIPTNQRTGRGWLWASDGQPEGTILLKEFGPSTRFPQFLAALEDQVFLGAADPALGYEPWTSDGTPAGTALLLDIRSGPGSSIPTVGRVVGGRLLFSADDDAHGREWWASDGTSAGTRLFQDIRPGPADSYPSELVEADGGYYFTADDGVNGRQPWFLPEPGARRFSRGDANGDARLDLTDAIAILRFLFLESSDPPCLDALDFDDGGRVDITDAVQCLGALFLQGPPPAAPVECGFEPGDDRLDCRSYPGCR